jgi:hypothetical protein
VNAQRPLPGAKCGTVRILPWARLVCHRPLGHVEPCLYSVHKRTDVHGEAA